MSKNLDKSGGSIATRSMMLAMNALSATMSRRPKVSKSFLGTFWNSHVLILAAVGLVALLGTFLGSRDINRAHELYATTNKFGPVIRSIVQQHRYGFVDNHYGWWNYAGRMPLIPWFGAACSLISKRQITFLLLKNLVFWPLWAVGVWRLMRLYALPTWAALLPAGLMILSPYVMTIASRIDSEEAYLVAMLCLLYASLLGARKSVDMVTVGLVLAAIYLTKSSMALLCLCAALWAVVANWKQLRMWALIPLVCVCLTAIGWATYIHARTGVYAFGSDSSSWNGWNFYKGNNALTDGLYPRVILDNLDTSSIVNNLRPPVPVHNEWELDHAQMAMGREFVRSNPGEVRRLDLKKLFVVCCDLKESPEHVAGHSRASVVFSNFVSHACVALVLLAACFHFCRYRLGKAEMLFLLISGAYLLPYFVGFVYMRHLVPLYALSMLLLTLQIAELTTGRRLSLTSSAP